VTANVVVAVVATADVGVKHSANIPKAAEYSVDFIEIVWFKWLLL